MNLRLEHKFPNRFGLLPHFQEKKKERKNKRKEITWYCLHWEAVGSTFKNPSRLGTEANNLCQQYLQTLVNFAFLEILKNMAR